MSTDLSKLNRQQKEAVIQSINHNMVLLAGAGSGQQNLYTCKKNRIFDY